MQTMEITVNADTGNAVVLVTNVSIESNIRVQVVVIVNSQTHSLQTHWKPMCTCQLP